MFARPTLEFLRSVSSHAREGACRGLHGSKAKGIEVGTKVRRKGVALGSRGLELNDKVGKGVSVRGVGGALGVNPLTSVRNVS